MELWSLLVLCLSSSSLTVVAGYLAMCSPKLFEGKGWMLQITHTDQGPDIWEVRMDVCGVGTDVCGVGMDVWEVGMDVWEVGMDVWEVGTDVWEVGMDVCGVGTDVPIRYLQNKTSIPNYVIAELALRTTWL